MTWNDDVKLGPPTPKKIRTVSPTVGASLSINVFALRIGPQFNIENDNTQKACLTFNLQPTPKAQEYCGYAGKAGATVQCGYSPFPLLL
jgi:hypothetical protein